MNAKLTILLTLSLTAAGFSATVQADPNAVAANPKFVSGDPELWLTMALGADGKERAYSDPGSIRPTSMAEIGIPRNLEYGNAAKILSLLMKSPPAQKFSKAQKDFLAEGYGVFVDLVSDYIPGCYLLRLYAISEEDAKTMALAFLDFLASDVKRWRAEAQSDVDQARERLQRNQATLPQKEEELKTIEAQYTKLRKDTYPSLTDHELEQTVREIVAQMDKEDRILEIELAGVRGKLKVIDKYIYDIKTSGRAVPEHLETWKTEQMIELSGLEARQQAIASIRAVPQKLDLLGRRLANLDGEVQRLTSDIREDTRSIEERMKDLEDPPANSWLRPTKIHGNTVVIRPVRPPEHPKRGP